MAHQPKLSLIISFYNDIQWLRIIFEMLNVQSFSDFEVIIADDGSSSELKTDIENLKKNSLFPVTHAWHPDKGWRKNIILNKAISLSNSDYLVFIDGDCIPHKNFLEEHYNSAQKGVIIAGRRVNLSEKMTQEISVEKVRNGYLSGKVLSFLYLGMKKEIRHAENAVHIKNHWLRKIFIKEKYQSLLGCNFSIHKEDILKVNGFDERFLSPATGEDTDLEARLKRINIYVKTKKHLMIVYHKYHIRKEVENDPNILIFKENNDKEVTYTPYGINKETVK